MSCPYLTLTTQGWRKTNTWYTFPLQALGHDIYSVSLDLTHGGNGLEVAMQAAAKANLWHRRLGHLNRNSELQRACARLRRVHCGQESTTGSSQDRRPQGQAPVPSRVRRPDGTLNSRYCRGLQVHHKDFPMSTRSGRRLIC